MDTAAFGSTPFSAEVDLWLETDHGRVELAQVSSTFLIADEPQILPPCAGVVVTMIDGDEQRSAVELPDGMSPEVQFTPVHVVDRIAI